MNVNRAKGLSLLIVLILSGFFFCIDARAGALEDAVDNPVQRDTVTAVTFSSTGAALWTVDTTTFYSNSANGASARSGVIGNSAYSSLTATVSGPATLSFYQKVSSQATYDGLSFLIDNNARYKITGPINWKQKRYTLGAGDHALVWKYSKNGSGKSGVDAAWIDKVIVSPSLRVQLLTPNNGGVRHPGDKVGITWTAPAGIDNFKLYYTVNNGLSYALIHSATGTSYTWTVPPINGNKTWCRVKVIGFTSAAAVSVGSDVSDYPFTIDVLKVNAPNGSFDSPTGGASANINYTLGATRSPAASVLFYYTMDGAVTWKLIGTDHNVPAGDHTHAWTVPRVSTERKQCKVKIIVKNSAGTVLARDMSDSYFWIYPAPPAATNKQITSFLFTNATATVTIDQTARIIEANVATGTSVTGLVASYVTTGQLVTVNTVTQTSGVTPNDFTTPVTYTVTAEDKTSQNYTVFVTIGRLSAQWAKTPTLAGDITAVGYAKSDLYSLVAGTDSSVVGAGTINGPATFCFSTLITAEVGTYSGDNGLLVKYDGSGVPQWATAVSVPGLGSTSQFVSLATVTADGALYAAGNVNGTGPFDFGNGQTVAPSFAGDSVLLVKYDSSGVAQWARTVSGGADSNDDSAFSSVAAAPDGSVYAAGFVYSDRTFDFGNGKTILGSTYDTGVLVKYDGDGAAQWVQNPVAYSSDYTSVAAAPDGSIYAAGRVLSDGTGTVDFGNGVALGVGPSTNAAVLVKYDNAGAAQWAKPISLGSLDFTVTSLAMGPNGSIYASAQVRGGTVYDFGNGVTADTTQLGYYSPLLIKFDGSGIAQWGRTLASATGSASFTQVTVGADGSAYVSGIISNAVGGANNADFGDGITVTSAYTGGSLIVALYDSSGTAQSVRTTIQSVFHSAFNGVALAPDGSVYTAGNLTLNYVFGFGNLVTAQGGSGAYDNLVLVKYKK